MENVNNNASGGKQRSNSIKTMKLYSHCERIYNELSQLGITPDDPLDISQVSKFDQYHYHGTDAVEEAAKVLGINSTHSVLDIGSGLGGPSRFLAHTTGCDVTAIEMQEDLNQVAMDLTMRCDLSKKVNHLWGNFLNFESDDKYDFIVSWLVFLHIVQKRQLFSKCANALKSGGKMYIEDFWTKDEFSEEERKVLKDRIYVCNPPPTKRAYVQLLQDAGFTEVEFVDATDDWTQFCRERALSYRVSKARQIKVHGTEVFEEQDLFFSAMDFLFSQGHLGGCKIVAKK